MARLFERSRLFLRGRERRIIIITFVGQQIFIETRPLCIRGWVFLLFKMPVKILILQFYFLVLCSNIVLAQSPSITVTEFEIDRVVFQGNESINDDELETVIQTKQSPWWFSKFLYNTLGEKFGSKPEFFDEALLYNDVKAVVSYYHNKGFYDVQVTPSCQFDSVSKSVEIIFLIAEHKRSIIGKVEYKGLEHLDEELRAELYKGQLIHKNDYYEKDKAEQEITRVLNFLINRGFLKARFEQENSIPKRYLSTGEVHLTLTFETGQVYRFGETTVRVEPYREDIRDWMVLRHLEYKQGEVYSHEKEVSSERNLNRLDVFEMARVERHESVASEDTLSVPIEVVVRPRARNELAPEFTVSDENNTFNLGIGFGYANRNFLGDARTFHSRFRIRTQSIQDWDFGEVFGSKGFRDTSVIGAVELQFQFVQPYLFTGTLSGSWTLTLAAEKQRFIILSILRNKLGLNNQFATYTYGSLDWTLERISPEISPDVRDDTTRSKAFLANLRAEDQPQINSIFTITLQRDKTNDIFSPTSGFFHSITFEESGSLPRLLPGIRGNLPFTEYYKVTLLGRWYRDLTATLYNIFALKLRTGYQAKYGKTEVNIPLNRRFFAGGSGSVRGWKARELGAMQQDLTHFGGNLIFEGSAEMRVHYLRGFGKFLFLQLDNIWGVYFLDFGNVWNDVREFKPSDIAVAIGLGLRYETYLGPFRIDYGLRFYDPMKQVGNRLIFQRRLFADVLAQGVFHFGIGHAF